MRPTVRCLLPALLLSACALEVKPQLKAAADAQAAAVRPTHREGAPRDYAPQRWSEGQWTLYKLTNQKGEVSILKSSVVRRDKEGWWLETEVQSYFAHTVQKSLVARPPAKVEEVPDLILRAITSSGDAKPQIIDFRGNDPMAVMMKGLMKGMVSGVLAPFALPAYVKEDAEVPAGTFRGAARFASKVSLWGVEDESTVWFHPAVPLQGMVKSTPKAGGSTMVLLDFGQKGAVSALKDVW